MGPYFQRIITQIHNMSDEDGEALDPMEELLETHRKEKKELQAKIQELKKTASKGDKKKKKEINNEIAKLEADLEQKHSDELLDIMTSNISINETSDEPTTNNSNCDKDKDNDKEEVKEVRVSKAQKRRDKKAEKEKQRLLDIEKQEEENLTGQRNLEQEAISKLLDSRGLSLHEVPSDGDCMFAGLVHQLSLVGEVSNITDLRHQTSAEMRSNSGQYLPFLSLSPPEFEVYCNKMASTKEWGGQVELLALTNILKRPIEVLQAEGSPMVVGEHFQTCKLILTYHRHAYGLGEHYNSVVSK